MKMRLCICLSLMFIILSGCWDRREVNDILIITAAAIDLAEDNTIELSIQGFIPKGGGQAMGGAGGGTESKSLVRSAKGVSIADALSKLQAVFPRHLFWGHTEVYIFGEALAKDGVRAGLDFMVRNPNVREEAFVYISKGKAKDILLLTPPLEANSAQVLQEMSNFKIGLKVTIGDLVQMLIGDAETAVVPWIEIVPTLSEEDPKKTITNINGSAVFKRDQMIGRLDARTTRGLMWIRDEIKNAYVTISPDMAEGHITFFLLRSRTKLIPKIENGKRVMIIQVETEDDVIQNATELNIADVQVTEHLVKKLEDDIRNRILLVCKKVQKQLKTDVFGFAEAFHRKYPKQWKQMKERWDVIYPDIEVKVIAKAHIRRIGMNTYPAGVPEEEVMHK
jgi:spore germination protein KC